MGMLDCPRIPETSFYLLPHIIYTYIYIRPRDTGGSFEPIFMKFTRLTQVYPWVNSIVFGNNQPSKITDRGKCAPQSLFFWLSFSWYGIFEEKSSKKYSRTEAEKQTIKKIMVLRNRI